MKFLFLLTLLNAFCGVGCRHSPQQRSSTEGFVANDFGAIWPGATAAVCWENGSLGTKENQDLVKSIIEEQFNKRTVFKFTGWDSCTATSRGIRINIADEFVHTWALGANMDGMKNGMVLNFAFVEQASLYRDCTTSDTARKLCIRNQAIHEFGHALGLDHEQNRPDSKCRHSRDTSGRGILIGSYDSKSIMNYCFLGPSAATEELTLSDGDINAINTFYADNFLKKDSDPKLQCLADGGTWGDVSFCCQAPSNHRADGVYKVCT